MMLIRSTGIVLERRFEVTRNSCWANVKPVLRVSHGAAPNAPTGDDHDDDDGGGGGSGLLLRLLLLLLLLLLLMRLLPLLLHY